MFLLKEDKRIIIDFLNKEFNPKIIYLFGSFARGEGRNDSDIDLAIYTEEKVSPYDLFIKGNNLAFELKRDVQIVNLRDISTVFAAQIVGTKEVLYYTDDILMSNYDIRVFKEYVMLNEERKMVLDAIEKDGRVYG